MKKILLYLILWITLAITCNCQVNPNNPRMLNIVDSLPYHTMPVVITDSFSVIEIREITKPVVYKYNINGKRIKVLRGPVIPENKNVTFFFRYNQVFFIRLRKDNTVYGIISIAKKKKSKTQCEKKDIIVNNSYLFTIKPYNKENIIPNEKLYFKYEYDGVILRICSWDLFIENIYTTGNLYGIDYVVNS